MTNKDRRLSLVSLASRPTACGARQKSGPVQKPFEVPDEVLAELREDVMARRVEHGVRWFEEHRADLGAINPEHRNSAPVLGYLSQWVGASDGAADVLRDLMSRFPQ